VATITGVNLSETSQVFFGTVPAASFEQVSPTQDRATVGAGGTGQIRVVTIGGTAISSSTFAFAPAPNIGRITPSVGGNNTIVTIQGRYVSSAATVTFGGFLIPIIARTDSSIQVRCPNVNVSGAIRVGTAGGVATTTTTFTWLGTPQILSVSPGVGTRRAVLTITGANLSIVDSVFVGGVPVESITVNSPTQISVAIRDGSTGTVVVRTPAGQATSATIFFYSPIPELRTITQNNEPINAAVGGTTVLLSGDHFLFATRATFGSLTGANLQVLSQTRATVQVPIGVTTALVSISTPGGTALSRTAFEVQPFVAITGFSPSLGTTGTLVEITGRNFSTGASVSIAGSPATDVRVLSTTQILAVVGTIPPRVVRGTVIVTTANGTASSSASFLIASAPPIITEVEPTRATFGSIVNVRGQFLTGVREVTIGGGRADIVQAISATELTVRVSRNSTSGTLALTTIGGSTTSSQRITVIPSPFILSFSPPFTVTGGTITIRGGNLTGISSVLFNDTPAVNFTVQSDTVIIAQIGTGSSGTIRISGSRGSAESLTSLQVLTQLEFETAIVRTLYDSLGGQSWTNRATNRWLSADPVRDWAGITVENGRITQIRLPDNNLRGTLPEAIAELQGLRVLDLSDNAITGAFPTWIARLTSLEELRIGGNQFTGEIPNEIGALSRLRVIVADRNRLTGRIPPVVCSLTNIEELNLRQNALIGDLLTCLGMLARLRTLNLGDNRLTGTIPPELGNIQTLQALYLDRNQITGTIPATFGTTSSVVIAQRNTSANNLEQTFNEKSEGASIHATPNLRFFWVNGNQLTGDLPSSLGNLSNLEELRVENNRLSGGNIIQILPRLRNIQTLDVGRNQLSGTIPSGIAELRRLRFLALRNNQFSGEIPPQIATLDSLQTLFLDSNAFTGALSAQFRLMRSLQTLGVSFNRLTTIPGFTSPSIVSSLFVQGNRLQFGDLQTNAFIPNFVYAPQDSIGAARDTSVVLGNPLELSIAVTGRSNQYQWFRNGVEVRPTSATVAFRTESFTVRDTGSYVCVITNTIMDRLRLVSRPLRVVPVPPRPPTQAPELVFPQAAATFIAFAPTLIWTRVDNAVEYEVQVAERRDFAELITTATVRFSDISQPIVRGMVSGLLPLTQYYWRVRAVNGVGVTSPFSLASNFVTAPPGTAIAMSSVNFGNTVLGESSTGESFLTNLTNDDLLIRDVDGNDAEISFRIPLDIRGLTLRAGQTLSIPRITFAPRSVGTKEAPVQIRYINAIGREDTIRLQRVLVGRGTPVKALAINMDTIRLGAVAQSTAIIVNRGGERTRIRVTSATFTNTATGFSVEAISTQNPVFVGGGDTTAVIIRSNPTGVGNFTNTLRYIAEVEELSASTNSTLVVNAFRDTLFVPLTVFVREARQNDVSLQVGIRPVRGQDSVAPGGKVELELFLRDSARGAERMLLLGVPLTFSATIRFNSQVLSLTRGFRPYNVRNLDARARVQRVSVPYMVLSQPSDESLVEQFRRTGVFMRITCASVSGDIEQTSLVVEDVRWGIDTARQYIGEKRVFLEGTSTGTFTALACKAGGTRLVTTARPNSLTAMRPNPVHDVGAITYTVREDGNVQMFLVDILGNVAKTIVSGEHHAGEYQTSVPVKDLPTGTYFLVMQTPNAILTERVQVRR
jgi:Leucine-rich repeat (LRR) protein